MGKRSLRATSAVILAILVSVFVTYADAASDRHGNVRLILDGADLRLVVTDGDGLVVNGNIRRVSSSGATLSSTGMSANTTYYIYAIWSGTSVALEASTTGHALDTTTGNVAIRIKSGDASRTLVGMARTNASAQWVDSPSQRFVLSWFKQVPKAGITGFAANRSTTSLSWVELSSGERLEFLVWESSAVTISVNAAIRNSGAGNTSLTTIGIDGSTPEDLYATHQFFAANADASVSLTLHRSGLSEGYHYATILGKVDASTGTWFGSSNNPSNPNGPGNRTTIGVMLQG